MPLSPLPRLLLAAALLLHGVPVPLPAEPPAPSDALLSYAAHLDAVEARLRLREPIRALPLVARAPLAERDWEWRHLAARADRSAASWDVAPDGVFALDLDAARGRLAAGCHDHAVRLIDAASGAPLATLAGHAGPLASVRFDATGARLLSTGFDGRAILHHLTAGPDGAVAPPVVFAGHRFPVTSGDFHPAEPLVATCSYTRLSEPPFVKGEVHVWNAATGATVATFHGGNKPLSWLRFSADGRRVLAGSWDFYVVEWEMATGEVVRLFEVPDEGRYRPVDSLALSPDGATLAAATRDGNVWLWARGPGAEEPAAPRALRGSGVGIDAVAFSPDGATVYGVGHDATLRAWATTDGVIVGEWTGHRARVRGLAVAPDGRSAWTASLDGTVRRWDLAEAAGPRREVQEAPAAYGLAWSRDGERLLVATAEGVLRVRDGRTLATRREVVGGGAANHVAWSADERWAAAPSWSPGLMLVDLAADTPTTTTLPTASGSQSVAFHPAAPLLAVAGRGGTTEVWTCEPPATEAATGSAGDAAGEAPSVAFGGVTWRRAEVLGFGGEELRFSDDGAWLAVAGAGGRVFDATTWAEVAVLEPPQVGTWGAVAIAPDRSRLVLAGSGAFDVIDTTTWERLGRIEAHGAAIHRVAFHPGGRRFVTGATTLLVWDAATLTALLELPAAPDGVWSLAFAPGGDRLAIGTLDGRTLVWGDGGAE